jgi:hypothetical protein
MTAQETSAAFDAKVLRAFVRDGRLVSIPAQPKKRLVVLRFLVASCFPDDRHYTEVEVNERLKAHDEDVAALRRYMVESGLMARASGIYRRTTSGT